MIVELLICRLRPGKKYEDYLQLVHELRGFLKVQPGFVSHELCVGERDWAHRVVWRSSDDAKASSQKLAETELAWDMSELVEPSPSSFLGRRLDDL